MKSKMTEEEEARKRKEEEMKKKLAEQVKENKEKKSIFCKFSYKIPFTGSCRGGEGERNHRTLQVRIFFLIP